MEKEFVSYEQSVALKELGFNEMCFGFYSNSVLELMKCKNGEPWMGNGAVAAPLKQQAFRWFRENYNLSPNIWSGKINQIFYGYDIVHIKKQKFVINNTDLGGGDCDYETYEEAEDACISKLIEICKQQDND